MRRAGERAWGELEDDFHHFRVELRHDGSLVTDVVGSGLRSPWTTCLDAGVPLRALVGTRLTTGPLALSHLDARQNCTHMFDLAGLIVTHAARGVDGDRVYDIAVDDPAGGRRRQNKRGPPCRRLGGRPPAALEKRCGSASASRPSVTRSSAGASK